MLDEEGTPLPAPVISDDRNPSNSTDMENLLSGEIPIAPYIIQEEDPEAEPSESQKTVSPKKGGKGSLIPGPGRKKNARKTQLKTSNYVGVTFRPTRAKYQARVYKGNKEYNLGLFDVSADAALACDITHRLMTEVSGWGERGTDDRLVANDPNCSTEAPISAELKRLTQLEENKDLISIALNWLNAGDSNYSPEVNGSKMCEKINFNNPTEYHEARQLELVHSTMSPTMISGSAADVGSDVDKTPRNGNLTAMIRKEAIRVAKIILGRASSSEEQMIVKKGKQKKKKLDSAKEDQCGKKLKSYTDGGDRSLLPDETAAPSVPALPTVVHNDFSNAANAARDMFANIQCDNDIFGLCQDNFNPSALNLTQESYPPLASSFSPVDSLVADHNMQLERLQLMKQMASANSGWMESSVKQGSMIDSSMNRLIRDYKRRSSLGMGLFGDGLLLMISDIRTNDLDRSNTNTMYDHYWTSSQQPRPLLGTSLRSSQNQSNQACQFGSVLNSNPFLNPLDSAQHLNALACYPGHFSTNQVSSDNINNFGGLSAVGMHPDNNMMTNPFASLDGDYSSISRQDIHKMFCDKLSNMNGNTGVPSGRRLSMMGQCGIENNAFVSINNGMDDRKMMMLMLMQNKDQLHGPLQYNFRALNDTDVSTKGDGDIRGTSTNKSPVRTPGIENTGILNNHDTILDEKRIFNSSQSTFVGGSILDITSNLASDRIQNNLQTPTCKSSSPCPGSYYGDDICEL